MARLALVLIAALVVGASAGLFVNRGTAQSPQPPAATASAPKAYTALHPKRLAPRSVKRNLVARIAIPRLRLATRIFPAAELARGPAWWPITGRPGGGDTVAIAGHRTTHTRPFYFLERVRRGDRIEITYLGRRHLYWVSRTRVASGRNLHIADAVGHERVLLTACTPRGSAAFRLVVEARPTGRPPPSLQP